MWCGWEAGIILSCPPRRWYDLERLANRIRTRTCIGFGQWKEALAKHVMCFFFLFYLCISHWIFLSVVLLATVKEQSRPCGNQRHRWYHLWERLQLQNPTFIGRGTMHDHFLRRVITNTKWFLAASCMGKSLCCFFGSKRRLAFFPIPYAPSCVLVLWCCISATFHHSIKIKKIPTKTKTPSREEYLSSDGPMNCIL